MKSRDFVLWLEGYLTGKEKLHFDEISVLHQKMSKVNLDGKKKTRIMSLGPTDPIVIKRPDKDSNFPGKPPTIYL